MSGITESIERAILGHLDAGGNRFVRLNLSLIAREIGVHQSTASRVAKSMHQEGRIEMKRPGWFRRRLQEKTDSHDLLSEVINRQRTLEDRLARIEKILQGLLLEGAPPERIDDAIKPAKPTPDESQSQRNRKSSQTADRFEEWWSEYPRKERKQEALKKWKARGLDAMADQLIEDVRLRKQSRKWQDGYIPHPTTYINGSRWEDEMEPDIQPTLHDCMVLTHSVPDRRVTEVMIDKFGLRVVNDAAQELVRQGLAPVPSRVLKSLQENHSETRTHDSRTSDVDAFARSIGFDFDLLGLDLKPRGSIDAEWWENSTNT